jgi:hypothetical protein
MARVDPGGGAVRGLRVLLVTGGVAVCGWGAFLLVTTLSFPQLLALTVWLAAMILVHDAVLAPTTSALRAHWYRGAADRPEMVTTIVQAGVVVGGILTLFVVPEIWAQGRGNPNPTILVGDYAFRLVAVWAVIGLTVLAVTRVVIRRSRR